MFFSYQTVVLAALAFEVATAQPAHRHMHQHHPRALSDVLGKRDPINWDDPSNYKNPATGKAFTAAEWACFSAGGTDATCLGADSGSAPPASSSASAPAVEEKLAEPAHKSASAPKSSPSASSGSDSDSGNGIHLFNKGSETQTFVFYLNTDGGAGYGQATVPDEGRTITLNAGSDQMVPLPDSWKGHVQRAAKDTSVTTAATWAEVQIKDNKGITWGDISLQKGCDGAAQVVSPTSGDVFGFDNDIISGAPEDAKVTNPDGKVALDYANGGWRGSTEVPLNGNPATVAWELKHPGQAQAYVVGGSGTDMCSSTNGVMHVYFY